MSFLIVTLESTLIRNKCGEDRHTYRNKGEDRTQTIVTIVCELERVLRCPAEQNTVMRAKTTADAPEFQS